MACRTVIGDDEYKIDSDGGHEDEEEDEEGQDEYEKDGFIVDDVEEEDEEKDRVDGDEERQKKRKSKKRESERNYVLDEDDYELLQENNISVPRPKFERKKYKRLKKAGKDTEEEPAGLSGEAEFDGSEKGRQKIEEKLKRTLFGDDDDGKLLQDIAEEDEQMEEEVSEGEDDDMADFIVDEEVDENRAPMRRNKPKKSRQQARFSSSALQEAHAIFGDVEDLLRLRKEVRDMVDETSKRSLEDQFDPSILSDKYMTEKDNEIHEIDVPERIQISEESTTSHLLADEKRVEMDPEWIYNQLVNSSVPLVNKTSAMTEEVRDQLKHGIESFLKLMRVQKFDVPFIAMYRKEEILSLLKDPNEPEADLEKDPNQKPTLKWYKVLWTIHDLDQKWLLLQKRKSALKSYYKQLKEESAKVNDWETQSSLNQQLFQSITKSLEAANSGREVDDVELKFNLHFPPNEVVLSGIQYKRPKKKSLYSICSKAGLGEVSSKFGYSAEQFGLQISLEKMRMDELVDAKETPEEMASNYTCAMFKTPLAVLEGARHMAAVEISCEPCVRKHVRSIIMENAKVSTSPTPDGNTAIDSFHQFSGVKWLRNKPLAKFEDAQWLFIQKAEKEKLLQVTIELPEEVLDRLISESNGYYLSGGVSKSAQLWDEQRKLILHDAFYKFLLPSMTEEAKSLLNSRAKSWLLLDYGKLLWDKVSVAPYQRKKADLSSDEETAPRVMACCWGPGKSSYDFCDVGFVWRSFRCTSSWFVQHSWSKC